MNTSNNCYKGYYFTTRVFRYQYGGKRYWEAYYLDGKLTRTIATSKVSLRNLRQKARLWIEMDIKGKEKPESDSTLINKEYNNIINATSGND